MLLSKVVLPATDFKWASDVPNELIQQFILIRFNWVDIVIVQEAYLKKHSQRVVSNKPLVFRFQYSKKNLVLPRRIMIKHYPFTVMDFSNI